MSIESKKTELLGESVCELCGLLKSDHNKQEQWHFNSKEKAQEKAQVQAVSENNNEKKLPEIEEIEIEEDLPPGARIEIHKGKKIYLGQFEELLCNKCFEPLGSDNKCKSFLANCENADKVPLEYKKYLEEKSQEKEMAGKGKLGAEEKKKKSLSTEEIKKETGKIEKISKDEPSEIGSFLRNINFVLKMANLNINSSSVDIQKNLIEPKFRDLVVGRIKEESLIFDGDYARETKYINELKSQLLEPIRKFLADNIDRRFEKEITEEEKQIEFENIGKSLANEIFVKLKFIIIDKLEELFEKILKEDPNNPLNKIKELSSEIEFINKTYVAKIKEEMEKIIKNKISEKNIHDIVKIESLFKTSLNYVRELFNNITLFNSRKNSEIMDYIKIRSKELADKPKQMREMVDKMNKEIEYRNQENDIVGDIIQLFPEVVEKVLEEEKKFYALHGI